MDAFSLLVAMNGVSERVTAETNQKMNDITVRYKDNALCKPREQQEHLKPHYKKPKKNKQH